MISDPEDGLSWSDHFWSADSAALGVLTLRPWENLTGRCSIVPKPTSEYFALMKPQNVCRHQMWQVNKRESKTKKMFNTDIWILTDGDKIQQTDWKNVDSESGTLGSNNKPQNSVKWDNLIAEKGGVGSQLLDDLRRLGEGHADFTKIAWILLCIRRHSRNLICAV